VRLPVSPVALGMVVGGCAAAGPETWSRPDATPQHLAVDLLESKCVATFDLTHRQEMGVYGYSSRPVFVAYMQSRGGQ
jgi:hypothetical protein